MKNINPEENGFEAHQEFHKYKTEIDGNESSDKSRKNYEHKISFQMSMIERPLMKFSLIQLFEILLRNVQKCGSV